MNSYSGFTSGQIGTTMGVAALMMAYQVAGKAARDGLFLSQFSASALPMMVVAAALLAVVVSILRGRRLAQVGPLQITAISFAVSGVFQVGEWLMLPHFPRTTACLIYLHVVSFGSVLMSGFWSLMTESFDPQSAKRIFGRIGGMGTLGGLCGGVLAERVAALVSASAVVLVLGVLHIACAALLWRAFPRATLGPKSETKSETASVPGALSRYPFLLVLGSLVLTASVGTSLLDFVFKAQAADTLGKGAPLVRFFGLYYTGTSLLTFLLQTFGTRFMLQNAGLAACAGVLPAAVATGSLAACFIPGFTMLSGIRAGEILIRGSLYRSAYELFFTAVTPADKRVLKPFIDVGLDRMGDAIGAAGVTLFFVLMPGRYLGILLCACAFSMLALAFAVRLQKGYVVALEKSLINRAVQMGSSLGEHPDAHSMVMDTIHMEIPKTKPVESVPASITKADFTGQAVDLRSGDVTRTTDALERLGPSDWAVAPLVIDLLAWDPVMKPAAEALRRMGQKVVGMLVGVLLDPDVEFTIRRRVPRVLAFIPSQQSVEGLYAALNDQHFEVRFYAARALTVLLRDSAKLSLSPERIWAVVNRELSLQKPVWQSHRLLDKRPASDTEWFFDHQLQERADRNLEHLFTLLGLLLPADAVQIAFRALHTEDPHLRGTAFEYLESATPSDTRRSLLQVLEADAESRLHSQTSSKALAQLLQSEPLIRESLGFAKQPQETHQ